MPSAAQLLNMQPRLAPGQVDRSIPMATPTGQLIPTPPTQSQEQWGGALTNPSIANILYGAGEAGMSMLTSPIPYAAGMVGSAYGALTGQDPRATGARFEQATTLQPQSPLGQYYGEQVGEKLSSLPPIVSGITQLRPGAGSTRYAAETYGMPLAEKSLSMYEQGKLTPGSTPAADIFIGENAKAWDKTTNARAVEMEKAGATPREIWSETMNWKGPEGKWRQEIDDSKAALDMNKLKATETVKMHEAFTHDPLYANYPGTQYYELGWEQTPGVRGSFKKETSTATTGGGGTLFKPEEAKSTLLHELTHGIQYKEGFAQGSNPAAMEPIIKQLARQELKPLAEGADNWRYAAANLGRADSMLYMHKLDKMSNTQGIKPRQLTKLSDFYEFSDRIRQKFGPMPKKPGTERDSWIADAAQFIKQKNIERKPYLATYEYTDPKSLTNEARRESRVMDKYSPDAKAYSQVKNKYKEILELPAEEQYFRSAGEAEARAVQERMNMNMEQRQATFPEDSFDRSMKDLIPHNDELLWGNAESRNTRDVFSILYK